MLKKTTSRIMKNVGENGYDDDDDEDAESDNADDSNEPAPWSLPNYAPFGVGYEVKTQKVCRDQNTTSDAQKESYQTIATAEESA